MNKDKTTSPLLFFCSGGHAIICRIVYFVGQTECDVSEFMTTQKVTGAPQWRGIPCSTASDAAPDAATASIIWQADLGRHGGGSALPVA